jgi:hypothetical protein
MNYRKIPFYKNTVTLDGLKPAFVPQHGFGPQYPNSSFLGATAVPSSATTVVLRPQPNAAPGFPGFFGWLRDWHPGMYNYAKAALPAYVTQAEGHRTGGATLLGAAAARPANRGKVITRGFFGEESADNENGIVNALDPGVRGGLGAYMAGAFFGEETAIDANGIQNGMDASVFRKPRMRTSVMNGLGDDSPDLSVDTSNITFDTPIPTVNIPDPNAETSSVGVAPAPSAGAVANIVSTLAAAAPSILNTVNQQTLFNTQLSRAQAGLPPLNTSAYGIGSTLTAGSMLPLLLIGGGLAVLLAMRK